MGVVEVMWRRRNDSKPITIKMNRGQARMVNHALVVLLSDPRYVKVFEVEELNRLSKGRTRIAEAIWPNQIDRPKRGRFMDERFN